MFIDELGRFKNYNASLILQPQFSGDLTINVYLLIVIHNKVNLGSRPLRGIPEHLPIELGILLFGFFFIPPSRNLAEKMTEQYRLPRSGSSLHENQLGLIGISLIRKRILNRFHNRIFRFYLVPTQFMERRSLEQCRVPDAFLGGEQLIIQLI